MKSSIMSCVLNEPLEPTSRTANGLFFQFRRNPHRNSRNCLGRPPASRKFPGFTEVKSFPFRKRFASITRRSSPPATGSTFSNRSPKRLSRSPPWFRYYRGNSSTQGPWFSMAPKLHFPPRDCNLPLNPKGKSRKTNPLKTRTRYSDAFTCRSYNLTMQPPQQ